MHHRATLCDRHDHLSKVSQHVGADDIPVVVDAGGAPFASRPHSPKPGYVHASVYKLFNISQAHERLIFRTTSL